MIELPNKNWLRSTKKPEYALCLDTDDSFFGWKMVEDNCCGWVSVSRLTIDEVGKAINKIDCQSHIEQLKILFVQLSENHLKEM